VSRDVPPNEIWGGVPAKKLKDVPAAEEARA
jgi:acetyltransferase-like isoleucine patch superfamily enzyme